MIAPVKFIHKSADQSVIIGIDHELGSKYLRRKMDEINLHFYYFPSLTKTVKRLGNNTD